ncbi:response regulator [Sabulicella glaciei]|uniref:Response regulator n=1 Tax=Sabulicella glaciei TaxID=2984948 RepID=A0ABT3P1H9_9PROT|nr:response regulator [Roseococcus sp. MDT2-1-1]MCW8088265.1 response regulator [Roseococcus sp. MDT2-1-1]
MLASSVPSSLSGLRVLLAENEVVTGLALSCELTRLGCQVLGPLQRLEEALAVAEAESFDVAILDVALQGGARSTAVAEALRRRAIPFIVTTGYRAEEVKGEYGDCLVLSKPYSPKEVQKALARMTPAA